MLDYVDYYNPMLMFLMYMVIFYLNFNLLINKFLIKSKRILFFVFINLVISFVFAVFSEWFEHYYFSYFIRPEYGEVLSHLDLLQCFLTSFTFGEIPNDLFYIFSFRDFFSMMLVVALSVAVSLTKNYYTLKARTSELIRMNAEVELRQLKSQLNPHFFFNTLNNIYSLILISPERAQNALLGLSRLMRYVLYEACDDKVLLRNEFQFISSSVELLSIRLGKNVIVDFRIPTVNEDVKIAPMIIIPLVGNAFKHGIRGGQESVIKGDISYEDGKVSCHVMNTYFPETSSSASPRHGIGLENLKRRLLLLNPGKYSFETLIEGGMYYANLIIDIS